MARVVLLPRPIDQKNDWPQSDDIFSLGEALVNSNLADDAHLAGEGIPSPWARALLMKWQLEDQRKPGGVSAVNELKALVLLQFLGCLRGDVMELSDDSEGLGRLSRVLRLLGSYQSLILWRAQGLDTFFSHGQVIAGTTRDCMFFAAADVSVDTLQAALQARFGPPAKIALLDARGDVFAPDFAATLAEYLRALALIEPGSTWAVALNKWVVDLNKVAGKPVPTARRQFVLDGDFTFPARTWMDQAPWDCPECVVRGDCWVNGEGTIQTVTAQKGEIRCPEHNVAIRKDCGNGSLVGYSDLGCHLADRLYVWEQREAWPPGATSSRAIRNADGTGFVEHRFNRQTLRVEGQLIKLSDVLLTEIAWPARRDGGDSRPVDIPIRGEYACLLALKRE